ncbi:hypothetical protein THRCLA_01684 [Thraustotheca clavata]|uniref:M96 mating-specific protein family n=1 Tax=Thraustotheca clavata TaxID=74557 RepID=A0A1W0A7L8_9STRA|nr:hypothetical protein THRCLA_01684 [Thraustotheca clavata]
MASETSSRSMEEEFDGDSLFQEPILKKRKKKRNVDELKYLRKTMVELREKLVKLETKAASATEDKSDWEAVARRQAMERHQAQQENARLKQELEQQIQLANALEILLTQQTQTASAIEDLSCEQLPINVIKRAAKMHKLVDNEFHRLETVFVQHGILGRNDSSYANITVAEKAKSIIQLTLTRVAAVPSILSLLADRFWNIFTNDIVTPDLSLKVLEIVDTNTIYYQFEVHNHDCLPLLRCNYVIKRYIQPHATSFVIRTMGHDPLHPISDSSWSSEDTIWIQLRQSSTGHVLVKMVLLLQVPYCDAIDPLVDLMLQCSIDSTQSYTMSELLLDSFSRTNAMMEILLGYNQTDA